MMQANTFCSSFDGASSSCETVAQANHCISKLINAQTEMDNFRKFPFFFCISLFLLSSDIFLFLLSSDIFQICAREMVTMW